MLNYYNTGVTVELGEIVESGVNIWDFDYPTPAQTVTYNGKTAVVPFDKSAFEKKIIDHYYCRQIGQETVGRWLHFFRSRIREIMPYYVQLYEFEAKWQNIEDPLESYNLTETLDQQTTGNGKQTGKTSDSSTSESSNRSETSRTQTQTGEKTGTQGNTRKFSNTPQGAISNLDSYLTEATQDQGNTSENTSENGTETGTDTQTGGATVTGSGTSENTSEDSGTLKSTMTRRGNIGVQPLGAEVKNIREAFINIDLMVINELKDLFLQVY